MADGENGRTERGETAGFQRLLGYRVAEWREDYAVVELALGPHHINRHGVAHGGVVTALIDTACGLAATWCPEPGRIRRVFTLSLTTSFVGSAQTGLIRAIGRRRGGGRRIAFCAADVVDATGRLLATGEGTFRYRGASGEPGGIPL